MRASIILLLALFHSLGTGYNYSNADAACIRLIHGKPLSDDKRKHRNQQRERKNMFADDDRPKPKKLHEIGSDLTFLSAGELDERIALLQEEIARLEADKIAKTSSRSAAEGFFKSK